MIKISVGLRFYIEYEFNIFKVVKLEDEKVFLYSELLEEDLTVPYKLSQFYEFVESGEIKII